jgi:hypothetical protein
MDHSPRRRWPRFSLRFLLLWAIPYVAVAAAVLAWAGPYESEFLNWHARWLLVLCFTVLWVSVLASGGRTIK